MRAIECVVGCVALLAWGCPREPDPPVAVADAGSDAAIPGFDEPFDAVGAYKQPDCARACANLQRLGCPEATRKANEDSCYVVCRRAQETGKIDFRPRCVADARDVPGVQACSTYRCAR